MADLSHGRNHVLSCKECRPDMNPEHPVEISGVDLRQLALSAGDTSIVDQHINTVEPGDHPPQRVQIGDIARADTGLATRLSDQGGGFSRSAGTHIIDCNQISGSGKLQGCGPANAGPRPRDQHQPQLIASR